MKTEKTFSQLAAVPAAAVIQDSVTINRALPLIDPATIVSVPERFHESPVDVKRAMMKLPEGQRAETKVALGDLVGKEAQLKADFGRFAPDVSQAAGILQRMDIVRAGKLKAQKLLALLDEQEDIANHDAVTLIDTVAKEVEHAAEHEPQIAERYASVMTVVDQRGAAIAGGMARARAEKKTAEKKTA